MPLEKVPLARASRGIVVSRVWQDGDAAGAAAGDAAAARRRAAGRRHAARSSTRCASSWGRRAASTCARMPSADHHQAPHRHPHRGHRDRRWRRSTSSRRFGVQITRVSRAEVEMSADPGLRAAVRRHRARGGRAGRHPEGGGRAGRLAEEPQLPAPRADVRRASRSASWSGAGRSRCPACRRRCGSASPAGRSWWRSP